MLTREDFQVPRLGECEYPSPLGLSTVQGDDLGDYTPDHVRIPLHIEVDSGERSTDEPFYFEKAGPRERLYFNPEKTRAAVVTCGGLCPGLNNVIRSLFLQLREHYGIRDVLGIPYGYRGLNPAYGLAPRRLTHEYVEDIHKLGGTVLGSSRGPQDPAVIVDFLLREGIDILFCVGGDGTQRGAVAISAEARRRQADLSVVGIPKTIDNDIRYVWRSFGYLTAVEKAREVLRGAHVEARGSPNGITVVKLMGREAGFIAAGAAVASQEVDLVLVPEVPFRLEGEGGLLAYLERRMAATGHAVIVVAEGAGQDLLPKEPAGTDASGNIRLKDIGLFLEDRIAAYFRERGQETSVRYIDPSYIIRSVPANTADSLLCDQLARHAVHAAMAGRTELLIGLWYNIFIHVPTALAIRERKYMNPESEVWMAALAATGQPAHFG
jgi:6-phosphofructokinase 1